MLVLYQYQDLLGHLKWCRIYFPSTVCLYTGWCLEGRSQGYLKTFENGEHFEATSYPGYNASQLALVDFVAPWDLWKLPNGNWMDRYEGLSLSNCWERSHLPDPFRRHFWSWWFSELLRGYVIINREGISVTCIKLISKIGDAASHLQKKKPRVWTSCLTWWQSLPGMPSNAGFFHGIGAPRKTSAQVIFARKYDFYTHPPRWNMYMDGKQPFICWLFSTFFGTQSCASGKYMMEINFNITVALWMKLLNRKYLINDVSHRIHVWYISISTNIWLIFMVNVGI